MWAREAAPGAMSERLTCPACGAHAFAFRREDDGALEITCLDCDDPAPRRALVPTLRLEERDAAPPPDPEVEERLRDWRADAARERSVPPYVVLQDRTVEELAREKPATAEALEEIHGIGPATLERYGDDLLGMVAGDGGGDAG